MIGVRIPDAKAEDYVSYNGDKIVCGNHGELILEEKTPASIGDLDALPASSRVMAMFAPGQWASAKQIA